MDERTPGHEGYGSSADGRTGGCVGVFLTGGPDPELDVDVAAPRGFLRLKHLPNSRDGLGESLPTPVGPETRRYRVRFPALRVSAVGESDGHLLFSWSASPEGPFVPFHRAPFQFYSILGTPNLPWSAYPSSEDSPHAPWLRALRWAVRWADGAKTREEAAAMITRAVYDLGRSPAPRLIYDGSHPHFSPHREQAPSGATVKVDHFSLMEFMERLEGAGPAPAPVDCNDIASVVYSMANLLGCKLTLRSMISDHAHTGSLEFLTRPVWPLGAEGQALQFSLAHHQVAWSGGSGADGLVYDASLALDGAGKAAPACGLRFGAMTDRESYLVRFAVDPSAVVLTDVRHRPIAPLAAPDHVEDPGSRR